MKKSTLVLLLVVVLTLVAGLFVLVTSRAEESATVPTASDASSHDERTPSNALELAAPVRATDEERTTLAPTEVSEPTQVAVAKPARTLRGHVVAQHDRSGISSAKVIVTQGFSTKAGDVQRPALARDARMLGLGEWVLEADPDALWASVSASAPGFQSGGSRGAPISDGVAWFSTIELVRTQEIARTLRVKVLDADGEPVPDARLHVQRCDLRPFDVWPGGTQRYGGSSFGTGRGAKPSFSSFVSDTDAHGERELSIPAPICIRVLAWKKTHGLVQSDTLQLAPSSAPQELTLRLARGATITGTVAASESMHARYAFVERDGWRLSTPIDWTTPERGTFELGGVPAGRHTLIVTEAPLLDLREPGESWSRAFDLELVEGVATPLDVR